MQKKDGDFRASWYFLTRLRGIRYEDTAAMMSVEKAFGALVVEAIEEVGRHLWDPLKETLDPDMSQVVLVPAGPVGLLPLFAAVPEGLQVTLSLSLFSWLAARRSLEERPSSPGLVLFSPDYASDPDSGANPFPFAEVEGEAVSRGFDEAGLPARTFRLLASPPVVVEAVKTSAYFHFAGHASYNWASPSQSGLHCLGASPTLTLQELRTQGALQRTRLVTLSACESGVSDSFSTGEEFIGLPATLLEVAAPAVVASLWSVDDCSTAFLMDEFYRHHLTQGQPAPLALREAARWLASASRQELYLRIEESFPDPGDREYLRGLLDRDIRASLRYPIRTAETFVTRLNQFNQDTPFAHPLYWAPFSPFGAMPS